MTTLYSLPTGKGRLLCYVMLSLLYDYLEKTRRFCVVVCVTSLQSLVGDQCTVRGLTRWDINGLLEAARFRTTGVGDLTVSRSVSTDPSSFKPTSNRRQDALLLTLLSVLTTVHVYTRMVIFLDWMWFRIPQICVHSTQSSRPFPPPISGYKTSIYLAC